MPCDGLVSGGPSSIGDWCDWWGWWTGFLSILGSVTSEWGLSLLLGVLVRRYHNFIQWVWRLQSSMRLGVVWVFERWLCGVHPLARVWHPCHKPMCLFGGRMVCRSWVEWGRDVSTCVFLALWKLCVVIRPNATQLLFMWGLIMGVLFSSSLGQSINSS